MKKIFRASLIAFLFAGITSFKTQAAATVEFTVDIQEGCAPLAVTFTNTSTGTDSYSWYFNDNSPAGSEVNPVHSFTKAGSYYVQLYAYSGSNYVGNYGMWIIVNGNTGTFYVSPDTINCPTDIISFNAGNSGNDFAWDFGDGSDLVDSYSADHAYNAMGTYTVTLNINGDCGSYSIQRKVYINNSLVPTPSFSINHTVVCPGEPLEIYNNTYKTYNWSFGDGGTSTLKEPAHSYTTANTYTVTLTATNGCSNSASKSETVQVRTDLHVSSSVSMNTSGSPGCPGTEVTLSVPSGYPSYSWDFGNGQTATSTSSYVSHIYALAGNYTASVKITNYCGKDTTLYKPVDIITTIPVDNNVKINASPQALCPGGNVFFSATQGYGTYVWNFGDNSPKDSVTDGYPYSDHTYNTLGTYTASVRIINDCGNDTVLYKIIQVTNSIPVPNNFDFDAYNTPACVGSNIHFEGDYGYLRYEWDFGDGSPVLSTPYAQVDHIYTTVNTYTASVKVTNRCGNNKTFYKTIVIDNTSGITNAGINPTSQTACPNDNINFNVPYGYSAYVWNYGDGTPVDSTNQSNRNHVFTAAGNYTVTVKIYNNCGKTALVTSHITINNNIGFANSGVYLNIYGSSFCPNESVYMGTYNGYKRYIWNFGDGSPADTTSSSFRNHIYPVTGNYTVSVKITNNCDQDTTLSKVVNVSPNAPFSNSISVNTNAPTCLGDATGMSVNGGNFAYFVWNYGDGSALDSTDRRGVEHQYAAVGNYTVSVKIYNLCGRDTTLFTTLRIGTDIRFSEIANSGGKIYSNSPVCPGATANLSAPSGYLSYSWDFGDGTNAIGPSRAEHIYNQPGSYNISVKISNRCGYDTTITDAIIIDQNAAFPQNMNFDADPSPACPGELIEFRTEDGFVSYKWTFGEGGINDTITSSNRQINHAYAAAGTYYASVVITNHCGKTITLYRTIVIDTHTPVDNVGLSYPTQAMCANDPVSLSVQGGLGNYIYSWNFGDGTTAQTVGTGITHTYAANGTYSLSVMVINNCGSTKLLSGLITIKGTSVPIIRNDDFGVAQTNEGGGNGCPGDALLFFYNGQGNNNVWDFGDGNPSVQATEKMELAGRTYSIIKHAFASAGSYWVKLKVTNGCGNSTTDSLSVTVQSSQLANGGLFAAPPAGGTGFTTCKAINFIAVGGQTYLFDFGDGQIENSVSPTASHIYSMSGNFVTKVTVTNGCGNSATYTYPITVNNAGGISPSATTQTPVSCQGGNNGIASTNISGGVSPYTYSWSNGATTSTANNLRPGTYTVTITDNIGCSGSASVTLVEGITLNIAPTTSASSCGGATGSASLSVSGGTGPYSYSWNNGKTVAAISGLAAGSYTVVATDNNGCSHTKIVSISEANGANVSSGSVSAPTCNLAANGSAMINVVGGTSPYTYSWSNGKTTQNLTGVTAGTYSVEVKDAANCKSVYNVTITAPTAMMMTSNVVGADCGQFNGSGTVSVTGGTSPYSYSWDSNSGGKTTATVTGLPAGSYTVYVTDNASCLDSTNVVINNPNAPNVNANVTNVGCNGQSNGAIALQLTGGTSPYLINWLFIGGVGSTKSNLTANTYYATVQDASGCLVYKSITVSQPNVLTAATSTTGSICSRATGTATVNTSGGNSAFTYSWSNGSNSSSISGLAAGTYTVSVTDNRSCSASATATINTAVASQELCQVTVDDLTGKVVVLWTKAPNMGTKEYKIYRENSVANQFDYVVTIPYTELSSYLDTAKSVNPAVRAWKYKISAVDSCNNESALSTYHKTIHLTAARQPNGSIALNFQDGYEGYSFPTYYVWRSESASNYTLLDSVPSNLISYTDINTPNSDSLYYFLAIKSANQCAEAKSYFESRSNTARSQNAISTAINNVSGISGLMIYPNPNNGTFNVEMMVENKQTITLRLYDVRGELIIAEEVVNYSGGKYLKSFDLTNYPNGIYHLQVITTTTTINNKIIID